MFVCDSRHTPPQAGDKPPPYISGVPPGIGIRGTLSNQSLVPAGACAPRDEKWRCKVAEVFVRDSRHMPPQAGDKPPPYISGVPPGIGIRGTLSNQSLVPAGACAPRDEKWRCKVAEVFVRDSRHTPPQAGDKPPPYISGVPPGIGIWGTLSNQSLVPAGACAPRDEKWRCKVAEVFVRDSRHTPPQAGDKPPPYISGVPPGIGIWGTLSNQSLVPAGACAPRDEKWRCKVAEVFVCDSRHTPPQAGDKPPPYILLGCYDRRRVGQWASEGDSRG